MNMVMEDEIVENNRIIAEFMLVKIPDRHYLEMNPQLQYYGDSIDEFGTVNNLVSERQLQYHSSWDWLMGVWKKLGGLMYEMRRQTPDDDYREASIITIHILKAFQMVDIDSAFNWITEGVKWYNNQKQKV